ncbi:MAG: hypothetical protein HKO57_11765 [Akkermansiaceae bacterium]|nr:hypothetical protein [Akkermansiaceae bacterium]
MKALLRAVLPALLAASPAGAIPNVVGGFITANDSALNGEDLTAVVLADGPWTGDVPLPGEWRGEAPVAGVEYAYLLARPRIFGIPALLVQTGRRDGVLDSLAITFADAGSYFGYYQPELPDGLSRRERQKRIEAALADRREAFTAFYNETLEAVRKELGALSGMRPREADLGKTRALRTKVTDYRHGEFLLRLIACDDRLIRVVVSRGGQPARSWLDAERGTMATGALAGHYAAQVATDEHGDTRIEIPVVPQGYKPYCGLNTLAMAARYFGLHLDEDQLAVAGRFPNTGTADGSQLPRLYLAVAKEARLDMRKANTFDPATARSCLKAGLPVIVWRRFSHDRDRDHTRRTMAFPGPGSVSSPEPDPPGSWPGENAPLHASVLVGYNDERREFLFLESWSRLGGPRRMHANELTATAYLSFYFKP